MKRFLENPFIGEAWLPLAESLLELHRVKPKDDLRVSTISSLYPKIDNQRRGPRVRIQFMDTGEAIMVASANTRLSRQLNRRHYQSMEFLGFLVPKTEQGEYAIAAEPHLGGVNENFIRVFDEGFDIEDLVETLVMLFVLVYKLPRRTMFFFGSSSDQHLVVYKHNKLARLGPWNTNENSTVFMFKDQVKGRALFEEQVEQLDAN